MRHTPGSRERWAPAPALLILMLACHPGQGMAAGTIGDAGPERAAVAGTKAPTRGSTPAVTGRATEAPAAAARAKAKARAAGTPAPASSGVIERGRAGMVVGIEPGGGELGPPTADQLKALQAGSNPSLDRSTVGLELVTLPDGSQRVDLQGRFRAYSVLTLAADGTARLTCVDGLEAAWALVRAGARPRATEPVRRPPVGPQEE